MGCSSGVWMMQGAPTDTQTVELAEGRNKTHEEQTVANHAILAKNLALFAPLSRELREAKLTDNGLTFWRNFQGSMVVSWLLLSSCS